MTTIEFEFSLGQRVKITEVETKGRIDSLSVDNRGPMYRVVYWLDGDRHTEWLYPWELAYLDKEPE